eukprot:1856792-Ditylum_brightwellii.AAC.1
MHQNCEQLQRQLSLSNKKEINAKKRFYKKKDKGSQHLIIYTLRCALLQISFHWPDKATQEEGTFFIAPIGHLDDLDSYLMYSLGTSSYCTPDHQILHQQYQARFHKAYPLLTASSPLQRVTDLSLIHI